MKGRRRAGLRRDGKKSGKAQGGQPGEATSHLCLLAGLYDDAVGGVIQFSGDDAQELGLVLVAIVVGRADADELVKQGHGAHSDAKTLPHKPNSPKRTLPLCFPLREGLSGGAWVSATHQGVPGEASPKESARSAMAPHPAAAASRGQQLGLTQSHSF